MILENIHPVVRQVVAALSASMVMFAIMFTWVFPAIALSQMDLPGSPITFTTEQAGWFASMPFLMTIPGCMVSGPLCERVGPRRIMLSLTPLLCLTTALMGAASWRVIKEAVMPELFLFVTRILQAAVQALITPAVSLYIYEVCDARRRGTMLSVQDCWSTSCFPICYLAGCYLKWSTVAWLMSLVMFVPTFIGLLVSPESPTWLLKKGRNEDAYRSLTQLRCSVTEISEELMVIKQTSHSDTRCWASLQVLRKRSNAFAMTVSTLILILKDLSGCSTLTIFIVKVFQMSGVGLDPCWSSVIVGLANAVFKGFACIIFYYSPRKPLLVVGNLVTAAGTALLGAFFYLQSSGEDVSRVSWLPLLGTVVFVIGYAGAVGPGSWIMSMEVLPGPVRYLGFSFGNAFVAATALLVSKTFENGEPAITLHGVFWSYTAACFVYIIFTMMFVMETRGRSLKDIEEYWESFNR